MARRTPHRSTLLLWITALLYGALAAAATDSPPQSAATPLDPALAPHIALLLPTGSDAFARAAEAVRQGFAEAAKKQIGTPIAARLYPISDDPTQVVATYRGALASGARLVVGPLTRNGVNAIAATANLLQVPTLALNTPEGVPSNPFNLYTLSLHIEDEAREIARVALADGRRKALTITDGSLLGRRMRDAFVAEFQSGGGFQIADYPYATDPATLDKLREVAMSEGVADMVFLALDASRARTVRPQLASLPAYGTSQINPGSSPASFVDLSELKFVDMPWMLQPDHPAVMVYSRGAPLGSDDLERLRALGIDAFRVAQELYAGKRNIDLDGVTGHLTLGPDGRIRRTLPVAYISGSQLSILPDPAAATTPPR
jgi:outer membrane PBP1 activator LpoA protein